MAQAQFPLTWLIGGVPIIPDGIPIFYINGHSQPHHAWFGITRDEMVTVINLLRIGCKAVQVLVPCNADTGSQGDWKDGISKALEAFAVMDEEFKVTIGGRLENDRLDGIKTSYGTLIITRIVK